MQAIIAAGDYVRDVSFPVGAMERAALWQPEPVQPIKPQRCEVSGATGERWVETKGHIRRHVEFNEADCGGAFDGNQVTSDADPGL